ncbi:MAG TPA: SpoIIE family protein phosphatase [Edaphobacter sp.]|jgi:hypothetical protein
MRRAVVFFALSLCNPAVVVAALQPTAKPDSAPVVAIGNIGRGAVPIDGEWQFHLGDDPRWAAPAYDDSAWQRITANKTWGAQTHPSYTGFAWYRRHLDIPPSPQNPKLAILMPPVEDAYELFWNGVRIGQQGNLPPHAVWYLEHRQSFALPVPEKGVTEGVLAIRVWTAKLLSYSPETTGGLTAPPVLGNPVSIARQVEAEDFTAIRKSFYRRIMNIIFAIMGVVALLTWTRNRQNWLFLWFGLWSLARGTTFLTRLPSISYSLPYPVLHCALQVGYSIVDCTLMLILLHLFRLHQNSRIRRWTSIAIAFNLGASILDGVLALFWSRAGLTAQWADAVLAAVTVISRMYVFVLVYQGIKRKLDLEVKLVAVVCFFHYVLGILRIETFQGIRFTHWTIGPWFDLTGFEFAGARINTREAFDTLLLLALTHALVRYTVRDQQKQTEIENELKSAREVQRVMIPEAIPQVPCYAIHGAYHPAREVGGDFFQIISLNSAATLVILGDVSGKGLKAALNVALIIGTVRTLAEFESDPTRILAGLNRRLCGRMQGGFTTALLLKLDCFGHCTLANAGHLPPFLNGKEVKLNESLPLGIVADAEFADQDFILQKGDHLTLYTDGVPEARCKKGELYGFERTRSLLANTFSAESVAQAARDFGQDDDITVLTIESIPINESSLPEIIDNSVSLAPT